MAAGDEVHVAAGAPSAEPGVVRNDKPAADSANQKNSEHSRGSRGKKGDRGRGEWSRAKVDKRKRHDEYREYKRRKVSDLDNPRANPFSKEEIEAESRRPKRKVAVMIGYAGTGYKGMQLNGDEETIERDLFQAFVKAGAISKANADDPRKSSLARCARTDKGVHAAGNVISLKLIIEDDDVVDKINEALPPQIRVWGIQRTNNSYNCYQYCDSRWYEYLMPSYCLLPPHPQSFLGKKLVDVNREYGAEEETDARLADVRDFWSQVDEKEIKPILARLDPETRAAVLESLHSEQASPEEGADEADEADEEDAAEPAAAAAAAASRDETAEGGEGPDCVMVGKEQQPSADNAEPAAAQKPAVVLETVQPKRRELGPIDYALRDIKAAYIGAKRAYRVSPERVQRLQEALNKYEGTNNFHNYTVQKSHGDPSSKRHIRSFVVNPEPIIIGDTEWLSLKVHGQSFMMHQIRKMVGLVTLVVRCGTTLDRIAESYGPKKMAIPKMPGLGLLLERPVFENYNKRAKETLGREDIDFDKYDAKLEAFKQEQIYSRIFGVEEKENSFHSFFTQIDQFRSNHFLWLTAGGMEVATIDKSGAKLQDVDKQLGDEDEEDAEGGEG
ncbi:trna pseudouridine38-40 synthase [Trichoderma cornu-damae]|uniref:tRNA pseudouridine synthase 1 n=1 Tax=Trichoderma cornu-damae TaxID=654480 RepID=A0A9P8QK74_9HYPO|nr:trna pseudouridine38-40 synthase [Trichoderma cornu-damae]